LANIFFGKAINTVKLQGVKSLAQYYCSSCGKSAKLPDFCCGKAMSQKDSSGVSSTTSPADLSQERGNDAARR